MGADEAHLVHGGTPVGLPVAQPMAGGGRVLAFPVFAMWPVAVVVG